MPENAVTRRFRCRLSPGTGRLLAPVNSPLNHLWRWTAAATVMPVTTMTGPAAAREIPVDTRTYPRRRELRRRELLRREARREPAGSALGRHGRPRGLLARPVRLAGARPGPGRILAAALVVGAQAGVTWQLAGQVAGQMAGQVAGQSGGRGQAVGAGAAPARTAFGLPVGAPPAPAWSDGGGSAVSGSVPANRFNAAGTGFAVPSDLLRAQRAALPAKARAAGAQARRAAARIRAAAARRERTLRRARLDPRPAARVLVAERGWAVGEFACLDALWTRESGWNYRATNPSSGAYGIPQALPASKLAAAGADWRTNPLTQIAWGLDYIAERYGSPCGAWSYARIQHAY